MIDRALRLLPDFGRNGETLNVVSTGSSLLKIALHPAGGPLREAIARVSAHPAIFWIEYQALADFISFYKVDPVAALKLPDDRQAGLRKLQIRHMLSEANAPALPLQSVPAAPATRDGQREALFLRLPDDLLRPVPARHPRAQCRTDDDRVRSRRQPVVAHSKAKGDRRHDPASSPRSILVVGAVAWFVIRLAASASLVENRDGEKRRAARARSFC